MKMRLSPCTWALVVSASFLGISHSAVFAADLVTPTKTSEAMKVVEVAGKKLLCPSTAFDASGKVDATKCTFAPGNPAVITDGTITRVIFEGKVYNSDGTIKVVTFENKNYYCPLTAFDATGKVILPVCTAIVDTPRSIEVDGKKYLCPSTAFDASGKADVSKCTAVVTTTTGANKTIEVDGKKYDCPTTAFDAAGKVDVSKCKPVTTTTTDTGANKFIELNGKKYECPLSAFDAATGKADLSKCKLLASTTTAPSARVVETKDGKFLCPSEAFSSTGAVDTSKCKQLSKTESDDKSSSVVCLPPTTSGAVTLTDSGTGTRATSSSSTSSGKCVQPSKVQETNPLGKAAVKCVGGGSRDVTAGYDDKTGILDVTINIKDCVDRNGAKHTGTATMQGTLLPKTGTDDVYIIKETKTILTTVVAPTGSTFNRACTVTRDGEYDSKKNLFTGKSTRDNCTLDGEYRFKDSFVDNLVENSTITEDF